MDAVDRILNRAVVNIIPGKAELEKVLRSGKKLNVYLGIDPTATHIHLGHAVPLRKLQALVELGHHVTFLIGDFTALIGDTSDKDKERPVLTSAEIEANFATYKQQAEKLLDFSKVEIRHNSEWLSKLDFAEIIKLARHFTLNDFIGRELIKKRLSEGKSVSLPEVLYPIMQGYDSYILDTDLQLGGTDQTFNMQAGRTLNQDLRGKDSYIMSNPFLTGTDGRKMSKSWGNAIWLDDSPNEMYGKVMSVKDDLLEEYFTLATNIEVPDLADPLAAKKLLAHQIVLELHGAKEADEAQSYFENTFQKGQIPQDIPTFEIAGKNIVDGLVDSGLAASKSEARRLLEQSGVKVNQKNVDLSYEVMGEDVISIGNRKFARVK